MIVGVLNPEKIWHQ